MENLHKKYLRYIDKPKKLPKLLDQYITDLLSNGHILEASYYFDKLYAIRPTNIKTVDLGYQISILTFNQKNIRLFDGQLNELKASRELITKRQLQYYYSMNNRQNAESCAAYLLENFTIDSETLDLICRVIIQSNRYDMVINLLEYFKKKKLSLNERLIRDLKPIIYNKFVDGLVKINK